MILDRTAGGTMRVPDMMIDGKPYNTLQLVTRLSDRITITETSHPFYITYIKPYDRKPSKNKGNLPRKTSDPYVHRRLTHTFGAYEMLNKLQEDGGRKLRGSDWIHAVSRYTNGQARVS